MTDTATKTPIRVIADPLAGPYIMAPTAQLEQLRNLLEANHVRFWVAHLSISVDGRPAVTNVYIARGTDPAQVQAILDTAA